MCTYVQSPTVLLIIKNFQHCSCQSLVTVMLYLFIFILIKNTCNSLILRNIHLFCDKSFMQEAKPFIWWVEVLNYVIYMSQKSTTLNWELWAQWQLVSLYKCEESLCSLSLLKLEIIILLHVCTCGTLRNTFLNSVMQIPIDKGLL